MELFQLIDSLLKYGLFIHSTALIKLLAWLWENGLVTPQTNFLVFLSRVSFGSFGVAIIIFTLIMRIITWPLTRSQLRSTRAMQAIQPRIQEIQKKYNDPKRRSEETMKLYREGGVNPLGCIWPMLVQFPIWIALFQSIRFTVGFTPENLLELSQRLYPWSYLRTAVPLETQFLGMDMGANSPLIMAILVGGSMWVQQRMMTPPNPSADPQQQSMNNMMLIMMPLMFGFFTLQFPSGLALYWVATNVVSIVLQYFYIGPKNVSWRRIFSIGGAKTPEAGQSQPAAKATAESGKDEEEEQDQDREMANESHRRRRRRRRGRRRRH
ncbi:MAG: membrane protein insertase YidC [Chloroflexi bacterium]|nr:membrane protein insertase YidC [Chloroflexota bacterium]